MLQEPTRDAFHHHSGSMEDFINSHRYSIPTQQIQELMEGKDDPLAEQRQTVPCSIIVFTFVIALFIIGAWVWLVAEHRENPVFRYTVFPFIIWGMTTLSSLIIRRQSRQLTMTGYPEFYERSSNAWRMNFGICSSACAIGTAFFILSQDTECWKEQYPKALYIRNIRLETCSDVLMLFWTLTLACLLLSYICLLCAYIRHNKKRVHSDWDYTAFADTSGADARLQGVAEAAIRRRPRSTIVSRFSRVGEDSDGYFRPTISLASLGSFDDTCLYPPKGAARSDWRGGDDISVRSKHSITSDHTLRRYRTYWASTIRRQAITIRYLEKQLKMLMTQLLQVQQAEEPVSRSMDDVFLSNPSPSVNLEEYQKICHEKQLLASENQSIQLQMDTKEHELLAVQRQLESMQVIRAKLDSELTNKQQELKEKKEKINELLILLAVERQATDQARSFLDDFDPEGGRDKRESKRRSRKKKKI